MSESANERRLTPLVGTHIATTIPSAPNCRPSCCGCINLDYIADEDAWSCSCNECGAWLGWAKSDWSNVEDRLRLGRDDQQRHNSSRQTPTPGGGSLDGVVGTEP